ncbi:hypothetical protein KC351_g63 [Hortaea werneckii]|nr:hypothetical protein KC351_g63 [Hortaea werneckii]
MREGAAVFSRIHTIEKKVRHRFQSCLRMNLSRHVFQCCGPSSLAILLIANLWVFTSPKRQIPLFAHDPQ